MKKRLVALGAVLVAATAVVVGAGYAKEDLEWTVIKQFNFPAEPVDVTTSEDGKWIFVLTTGEVQVYSVSAQRIVNRIPVGPEFDKLTHSPTLGSLILTSRSGKSLEIVRLEFIRDIPVAGLPFKGPENALVTIVVFDDYQ